MIYIFDIIKLIMSFLVVAVHVNPLIDISERMNFYLVDTLGRIPVPIFFTIAGYLLFRKLNKSPKDYKSIVIKYLKKIVFIYFVWSFIYFVPYYFKNPGLSQVFPFIPHLLIDGVYSQLWYMQSLIVAVVIATFVNKKIGIKKTLLLSLLFYIIGLLTVPYLPVVGKIIGEGNTIFKLISSIGKRIGRNGLFFGFFFITLGGYISQEEKLPKYSASIIGTIISLILLFVETTIIDKIGGKYFGLQISLIPFSYFLTMYMLNFNKKVTEQKNTTNIRILSFLIYLVHEWIHFLYNVVTNKILNISILSNHLVSYIIIIIVTIIISEIIIYLSQKDKFKLLKKLY